VNGAAWSAGRINSSLDETCFWIKAPAGWESRSCLPSSYNFDQEPIYAETAGTGEVSILVGVVAPSVKSLKLVRSNCLEHELALSTDRMFFSVSSASDASPYKLYAFDDVGASISSHALTRRVVPVASSTAAC